MKSERTKLTEIIHFGKRILPILLTVLLTVTLMPAEYLCNLFPGKLPWKAEAARIIHSGKDGDLDWSIDSSGCLRIKGSGDYVDHEWTEYDDEIKTAIVEVDNITKTTDMFKWCEKLTSIDVSYFDTRNVTSMESMFEWCESLTNLDVSSFNTRNVTNMSRMFFGCNGLTNLNISNFDTRNVTDMSDMFYECKSLINLDVSNFNTENVTDMDAVFYECRSLTRLDVSNFNTKNVTDMEDMFFGCSSLTSLDVSNFDTRNVEDMMAMFLECSSLTNLDVSNFDTKNVKWMSQMFYGCVDISYLDVSNFDTKNVRSMACMFSKCKNLTSLDVSNFNTRYVDNMGAMFSECEKLTSLDVSNFNTRYVEYMYSMFEGCKNITELDLSSFDTRKVTDMDRMFWGCDHLTELDLSDFDISNLEYMDYIFDGCSKLTKIHTPINMSSNVVLLPSVKETEWADSSGKVYTKLPVKTDYSIVLRRDPIRIVVKDYDVTKNYSKKTQSFNISAICKDGAKITYASNNKNITVNSAGKITIKAKYIGKAAITIRAAATPAYKESKRIITVTVVPSKTNLSGVKNIKGKKLEVRWKKNSIGTGYQIQYSRDSKFRENKSVTIKNHNIVKTTISKLTKGKNYYVRIRTYRKISNNNYYSAWSNVIKVRITK